MGIQIGLWAKRIWLVILLMLGMGTSVSAACRQALALGLDISGSVDRLEYRLQLDGLAGALLDPAVAEAFLAIPDANVRLFVYEWSGQSSQRVLLPWTEVATRTDILNISQRLRSTARRPMEPSTAIGQAMLFGAQALASQPTCWRRTIDLSGDGESNSGPQPGRVSTSAVMLGVTVNALIIGAESPPFSDRTQSEIKELSAYFNSNVIRGPDAFVQTAVEFVGFQDAMAKKLLKELQTRAVGALSLDSR